MRSASAVDAASPQSPSVQKGGVSDAAHVPGKRSEYEHLEKAKGNVQAGEICFVVLSEDAASMANALMSEHIFIRHDARLRFNNPNPRPLGFEISEKDVKRAGLDHWKQVDLRVHDDWNAFTEAALPRIGVDNTYLVSKRLKLGSTSIADVDFFPKPRQPPLLRQAPPPAARHIQRAVGASSGARRDFAGDGEVALVFGSEIDGLAGLEEAVRRDLPAVFLPMRDDVIRSYNLSNAVAMALYEVDRQLRIATASLQKHNDSLAAAVQHSYSESHDY